MILTDELVQYYRLLRRRGINDSHSGNGSVRDTSGLWITPTGACADTLESWQLVRCDIADAACERASQDLALHRAVYRRNRRANAVLHGHGAYAVALTLKGEDLAPVDLEGHFYFPRVPVIDVDYDEYFETSPELVGAALTKHPVAIVRGHGLYAWGTDLEEAYKWICSLELSAKITYLARR
ncbi:MAG: class II aldolase/adducin family protein, partial [Gammaproteobacteria bacterium]|nr:class II aldolase/adducin family protein [Gammaproteobacteria bacterium]